MHWLQRETRPKMAAATTEAAALAPHPDERDAETKIAAEASTSGGVAESGGETGEEGAAQCWTFDQALSHVGGWGAHQKWNVLYCGVPWLISGMFAFGPVTWTGVPSLQNAPGCV